MDDRLSTIFASIGADEVAKVAAAALGAPAAQPHAVTYSEIRKPHSDPRTIGIVRVSGRANVGGSVRAWSCVTKLIDLAVPNTLGTSVDPRNEVLVYQHGHFTTGYGQLRPAHCHHISRPREGLTILWLEDLTGAEGAPFDLNQLAEMGRHLGEWNAQTAARPPALDFPIGSDFFAKGAQSFNFPLRMAMVRELRDQPMVREMYAHQPLEIADECVSSYLELIGHSVALPHALSLADCPVSNFFHLPGETIAIDWAGLASQPLGADGGRFIGSALTWGRQFAEIALHERDLFEHYLGGLRLGGATEPRSVLRRGYLCELGFYLCTIVTLPEMVANPRSTLSVEFFEKRFDMRTAEFGAAFAPVIDLLPSYIAELRALAG